MNVSRVQAFVRVLMAGAMTLSTTAQAASLPTVPASVPVTDLPQSVFRSPSVIGSWIGKDRRDLMKSHAWDLFTAVMTPLYDNSGETVRLFDTWHSLDEVVPSIGAPVIGFSSGKGGFRDRARLRGFGAARQTAHGMKHLPRRDGLALSEAVVSDVKYSPAIGRMVERDLMVKAKDATGKTVVSAYNLSAKVVAGGTAAIPFNDATAVMLKPAFTIVKGKGPTVIARWEEKLNVTNPLSAASYQLPVNADKRVATERLWTQEAVVYPSTTSSWTGPVTYYGRDGTVIPAPANLRSLPKFNLTDFHYVKLTQAQVDSLKGGILSELLGPNIDNIEAGDYAVLTSMHIATREIDTWTWQTFWWQPKGSETLSANGASLYQQALFKLSAAYKPLQHFRAGVGYSYSDGKGSEVISSNPYLEGSFGLPSALDAVFGPDPDIAGVNIFLRNPDGTPLRYNGTTYVHGGGLAMGTKGAAFGLQTNCVTCHTAAAYPTDSVGTLPQGTLGIYPDYGTLTGKENLFVNRVRTHFLWGVANKIADREAAAAAP